MTAAENIELFQRNVLRLRRHPFSKQVVGQRLKFSWSAATKTGTKLVKRPTDHVISGYAALIRGFILNDDTWSLDRLPGLYHQIGASAFHEKKLKVMRQQLHGWLRRHSGLSLADKSFTYRELIEYYIYGNVVHFTRAAEFNKLKESWGSFDLFMHQLCHALEVLSKILSFFYTLNEMVLSKHSKTPKLP